MATFIEIRRNRGSIKGTIGCASVFFLISLIPAFGIGGLAAFLSLLIFGFIAAMVVRLTDNALILYIDKDGVNDTRWGKARLLWTEIASVEMKRVKNNSWVEIRAKVPSSLNPELAAKLGSSDVRAINMLDLDITTDALTALLQAMVNAMPDEREEIISESLRLLQMKAK